MCRTLMGPGGCLGRWFGHVVASMQSAFFPGDEPPSRSWPSRPRGARA